jgi:hypothetical protein
MAADALDETWTPMLDVGMYRDGAALLSSSGADDARCHTAPSAERWEREEANDVACEEAAGRRCCTLPPLLARPRGFPFDLHVEHIHAPSAC